MSGKLTPESVAADLFVACNELLATMGVEASMSFLQLIALFVAQLEVNCEANGKDFDTDLDMVVALARHHRKAGVLEMFRRVEVSQGARH